MIVDTMTDMEVTKEIMTDYVALVGTSLKRLSDEYNRERKRRRIPKEASYMKYYEIRTRKKNRWLVPMSKPPADTKFTGNACSGFITYHYGPHGLRVYKVIPDGGLSVFNSHVFQRYNERMGLNIKEPLEIIKHFFTYNGFFHYRLKVEGSTTFSIGRCREGLLLGTLENQGAWIMHRTFISKQMMKEDQEEIRRNMMGSLQSQIEDILNADHFDQNRYEYLADLIKGLNEPNESEVQQEPEKPSEEKDNQESKPDNDTGENEEDSAK
jgi:hypothetical protein